MAEIFQNRKPNIEHVGIYIPEHRMQFSASQELWNTPSQVCNIAACGWTFIQGSYEGHLITYSQWSSEDNTICQMRKRPSPSELLRARIVGESPEADPNKNAQM